MPAGTVKWFNPDKGYGFIKRDDEQADVFAHWSAIDGTGFKELKEGERVVFEVIQGPKGLQAEHLRRE